MFSNPIDTTSSENEYCSTNIVSDSISWEQVSFQRKMYLTDGASIDASVAASVAVLRPVLLVKKIKSARSAHSLPSTASRWQHIEPAWTTSFITGVVNSMKENRPKS